MSFISTSSPGILGPNPTLDTSIVRWNGTDGRKITDSLSTINDSGAISTACVLIDDNIPTGVTVTILAGKQLIVADEFTVSGTLNVFGTFRIV